MNLETIQFHATNFSRFMLRFVFSDGFVVLWKKGKDIVAVGNQLFNKDDTRVKVEETDKGNTLVISLAEPSDAGEYKCQISAPKPTELRHSVRIRGKTLKINFWGSILLSKQE